jgi:hypothetical protein
MVQYVQNMRVRMGRKLLTDARLVTIILVTSLIHFSKNGLIMNSEGHYWAPVLGTNIKTVLRIDFMMTVIYFTKHS